jgi:hypothetical protein
MYADNKPGAEGMLTRDEDTTHSLWKSMAWLQSSVWQQHLTLLKYKRCTNEQRITFTVTFVPCCQFISDSLEKPLIA